MSQGFSRGKTVQVRKTLLMITVRGPRAGLLEPPPSTLCQSILEKTVAVPKWNEGMEEGSSCPSCLNTLSHRSTSLEL